MFLPILIGSLYVDQYLRSQEEVVEDIETSEIKIEISFDDGDSGCVQIDAPDGRDQ